MTEQDEKKNCPSKPLKGILKNKPVKEVNGQFINNELDEDKGISWDEEGIQEYDTHRGQTQKIMEPKTPFIQYDRDNDKILSISSEIPPIELTKSFNNEELSHLKLNLNSNMQLIDNDNNIRSSTSSTAANFGSPFLNNFNSDIDIDGTNNNNSNHPPEKKLKLNGNDDLNLVQSNDINTFVGESKETEEWTSDDEEEEEQEDEQEREKHEKFEKLRHEHYNMKNALQLGKQLLDDEDDE